MYGFGLYCIFDLKGALAFNTMAGRYGNFLYRFAANLDRFIAFDGESASALFGAPLSIAEQYRLIGVEPPAHTASLDFVPGFSWGASEAALTWSYSVKEGDPIPDGILFKGGHDGPVAVVYNTNVVMLTGVASVPDVRGRLLDHESVAPAFTPLRAGRHGLLQSTPLISGVRLKKSAEQLMPPRPSGLLDILNKANQPGNWLLSAYVEVPDCKELTPGVVAFRQSDTDLIILTSNEGIFRLAKSRGIRAVRCPELTRESLTPFVQLQLWAKYLAPKKYRHLIRGNRETFAAWLGRLLVLALATKGMPYALNETKARARVVEYLVHRHATAPESQFHFTAKLGLDDPSVPFDFSTRPFVVLTANVKGLTLTSESAFNAFRDRYGAHAFDADLSLQNLLHPTGPKVSGVARFDLMFYPPSEVSERLEGSPRSYAPLTTEIRVPYTTRAGMPQTMLSAKPNSLFLLHSVADGWRSSKTVITASTREPIPLPDDLQALFDQVASRAKGSVIAQQVTAEFKRLNQEYRDLALKRRAEEEAHEAAYRAEQESRVEASRVYAEELAAQNRKVVRAIGREMHDIGQQAALAMFVPVTRWTDGYTQRFGVFKRGNQVLGDLTLVRDYGTSPFYRLRWAGRKSFDQLKKLAPPTLPHAVPFQEPAALPLKLVVAKTGEVTK